MSLTTLVIIGSESKYWDKEQEKKARKVIRDLILFYCEEYADLVIASGECPKGGIDIWLKEAYEHYKRDGVVYRGFPPEENNLCYYKKRNKEMARYGDIIIAIEPYNRVGQKSGAEWVLKYAQQANDKVEKEFFKEIYKIVIY